jgi:hypothetical protein
VSTFAEIQIAYIWIAAPNSLYYYSTLLVIVPGDYREILIDFVVCADVTVSLSSVTVPWIVSYVPFHVASGVFICGLVLDVGWC